MLRRAGGLLGRFVGGGWQRLLRDAILQQPIKFGADLVLYSATKYIDGQGRALGGAVVGKNDLLEEVIVWFPFVH